MPWKPPSKQQQIQAIGMSLDAEGKETAPKLRFDKHVIQECVSRTERYDSDYMQHMKRVLDPFARSGSAQPFFESLKKPKDGDWLSWKHEKHQGISEYIASHPNRPTKQRNKIYFQPLMDDAHATTMPDIEFLRQFTEAWFGLDVVIQRPRTFQSLFKGKYETIFRSSFEGGKQFNATHILKKLRAKLPSDAYARIGVTMCDIYSGDLNFVFGLGSLSGRTGLYSFCRQDDAFYRTNGCSQPGDEGKLLRRAAHTIVHELGHMCGMSHCTFYKCTMQGANSLEESESHPLHLCPVCLLKLKYCLQVDFCGRYEHMKATCEAKLSDVFKDEISWWAARLDYLSSRSLPSASASSVGNARSSSTSTKVAKSKQKKTAEQL